MGKLPAFQFYSGDWIQDTRVLSLAAKGAWIDLLCAMWRSQTRGSLTLSMVGYSRLLGATVEQTTATITELTDLQICDFILESNGNVTLINRRMAREEKERETTRYRVKRFRNGEVKRLGNANVAVPSSSSSSSSSIKNKESTKEKYLDFVFFLPGEYQKLINQFGEDKTREKIEALNLYLGSNGAKKYKSHYFTILNWDRMEKQKKTKSSLGSFFDE